MRVREAGSLLLCLGLAAISDGCGGRLIRQYEYEEEIYLDLDGSATVIVNSSVPALVALHGFTLDTAPSARLDRAAVRRLYQSPVAKVLRVSRPWRREGRRFIQVRIEVPDIRQLDRATPFAWSKYRLEREDNLYLYRQDIDRPSGPSVRNVGWNGRELVAFRLHLPSKIHEHNTPTKRVERGNILVWEQSLTDRLAGAPVRIEVRMEHESILYRTLWLFGLAFGSALAVMAALVWWAVRKG